MESKNHMRGELRYALKPHHTYVKLIIFYLVLLTAISIGMYRVASHIRTRDQPVGHMELTTPYTKYVVGEEVTFSLKNDFNSTIFLTNKCPAEPLSVYKKNGSAWVRIHDTASAQNCPDESRQIGIAPNATVSGSYGNWKNLFSTAGKYRIVAYVDSYSSLPYADFEVVDPASL